MHDDLVYLAYGWLALTGALHFATDVIAHALRETSQRGSETALYYGINTAAALGQVGFGVLGLSLAWRAMHLLTQLPAMLLAIAAALGWLASPRLFAHYGESRLHAGIFCAL
ncbi:hypothetical protein, partial [Xanthomonas maliensis]